MVAGAALVGAIVAASFLGGLDHPLPWLVAAGGLVAAVLARLVGTVGELQARTAFQESLLAAGPLVVMRAPGEAEGRVLYASPNARRLLGHTADALEPIGALRTRVHPEDLARLAAGVADLAAGAERAQLELRFRTGDDTYRWASGLVVPVPGAAGADRGIVAYFLDVDERHRAEEAARERDLTLAAVFAASPDVIAIVGSNGVLHTVSPAIERVIGFRPEELVGRQAMDLVHPDDRPALEEAMDRLQDGETGNVVVRYRTSHADGRTLVIESQCTQLAEGDGPAGIVLVARDVTERARLEQAQHAAQLAAEAANRSKSEFLSRMSHELRTPLNAVLGFAQLLELDELSESQRESTAQILQGGRHLLDLIDEVLDISRIETGRLALAPERVSVREVVQEAVELVGPLAAPSAVRLRAVDTRRCECQVLADRQRLKQILLNLLSNAVKYNRAGGTVAVSCDEAAADCVRIHVADTGVGIRPEHLGLLFTPFERLDATQTNVEGAGIGLALSQRLAEAMGGSISVASTVGEGSTFSLELLRA
ncbi:MAG: PAS domain S-box protein [Acidimicrobiia bacterium]|nr:PAS domain S-box protein [Acidimicrobiia bacterium]